MARLQEKESILEEILCMHCAWPICCTSILWRLMALASYQRNRRRKSWTTIWEEDVQRLLLKRLLELLVEMVYQSSFQCLLLLRVHAICWLSNPRKWRPRPPEKLQWSRAPPILNWTTYASSDRFCSNTRPFHLLSSIARPLKTHFGWSTGLTVKQFIRILYSMWWQTHSKWQILCQVWARA